MKVGPQSVTLYDLAKDLGLPAAFALILLFQIGPKLDAVLSTNAQLQAQLGIVITECARGN
jgi:hypothetical protein